MYLGNTYVLKRNILDNIQSWFVVSYQLFKKSNEKIFGNMAENLLTFFAVTSELFCLNAAFCAGRKYSWNSVSLEKWSFWTLLFLNFKLPMLQFYLVSCGNNCISYWSVIQVLHHGKGKQKLAQVGKDAFQPPPWKRCWTACLPVLGKLG